MYIVVWFLSDVACLPYSKSFEINATSPDKEMKQKHWERRHTLQAVSFFISVAIYIVPRLLLVTNIMAKGLQKVCEEMNRNKKRHHDKLFFIVFSRIILLALLFYSFSIAIFDNLPKASENYKSRTISKEKTTKIERHYILKIFLIAVILLLCNCCV